MDKALFFVKKTYENNWSRAVLLNFLDTNLYEREGKAITNFEKLLPDIGSDLAREITKDPYNFDFLTLREGYDEKELKDALMDNIQKFLLNSVRENLLSFQSQNGLNFLFCPLSQRYKRWVLFLDCKIGLNLPTVDFLFRGKFFL